MKRLKNLIIFLTFSMEFMFCETFYIFKNKSRLALVYKKEDIEMIGTIEVNNKKEIDKIHITKNEERKIKNDLYENDKFSLNKLEGIMKEYYDLPLSWNSGYYGDANVMMPLYDSKKSEIYNLTMFLQNKFHYTIFSPKQKKMYDKLNDDMKLQAIFQQHICYSDIEYRHNGHYKDKYDEKERKIIEKFYKEFLKF